MGSDRALSLLSRLFFIASFVLLAVAVLERVVNFFGYTFMGGGYTPGRMFEFAGIMLLFVIAILMRQTREELRGKKST
jgi:hypothetical protein